MQRTDPNHYVELQSLWQSLTRNVRWFELLVETVHQASLPVSKLKNIASSYGTNVVVIGKFIKPFSAIATAVGCVP
ncbi:MAG: hypothetical protein RBJ76_02105 [Stenomitos frigidus ULC029]